MPMPRRRRPRIKRNSIPVRTLRGCHAISPPACDGDTPGDLSADEQRLIAGYRCLDSVRRLAIHSYLRLGDDRLVVAVYHQTFLGLRPGQLRRQAGDELRERATPVQVEELPLVR